jgi:hypothetical protein
MKGFESTIAFICFHSFFRIRTFQRVTTEKIKKSPWFGGFLLFAWWVAEKTLSSSPALSSRVNASVVILPTRIDSTISSFAQEFGALLSALRIGWPPWRTRAVSVRRSLTRNVDEPKRSMPGLRRECLVSVD